MQGLGLAKQLAEKVNNKLNYIPAEPEKEEEVTSTEDRYEDEIEINSFPQQARWKITSKVKLFFLKQYVHLFERMIEFHLFCLTNEQ